MAYTMTPARKAALRKAQMASARKRKKKKNGHFSRNKKRYIKAGAYAAAVAFSMTKPGRAHSATLIGLGSKAVGAFQKQNLKASQRIIPQSYVARTSYVPPFSRHTALIHRNNQKLLAKARKEWIK